MFICFIWLVVAAVCVQIINLMGAKLGIDQGSISGALKMTMISLPISAVASFSFIMYFSRGGAYLSFPALNIAYMAIGLIVAFLIQGLILGSQDLNVVEILGIGIAMVGISVAVFNVEIEAAIKSIYL